MLEGCTAPGVYDVQRVQSAPVVAPLRRRREHSDRGRLAFLSVGACAAPAPSVDTPEPPEVVVEATPALDAPPSSPPAAEPTPEAAPQTGFSAEQAATTLFEAMSAVDESRMRRITLTYDQMRSISRKDRSRDVYENWVTAFVDGRLREFREAAEPVKLVRVEVAERGTLRAADSEKLEKDVPYARIAPVFAVDGKERKGMPMLFVDAGAGFRFSVTN